jgi:hypothetical protein
MDFGVLCSKIVFEVFEMLEKKAIFTLLETRNEHVWAKDILVPTLKKMKLRGVKFTGGPDEHGIDIEYFELTEPEKKKCYVGIQCKTGSLVYSGLGSSNSIKEVKNQAEEAFEKEIHDLNDNSVHYISRFVVATTGEINENARKLIGRARQKGHDRGIDYWPGDRLAEYIRDHYMVEFEEYFKNEIRKSNPQIEDDESIVDEDFLAEKYSDQIETCRKLGKSVCSSEWKVLKCIAAIAEDNGFMSSSVRMEDFLFEMEHPEDYFQEEFNHLSSLGYISLGENGLSLDGRATVLGELFSGIRADLIDAEENEDEAKDLFESLTE